MKSQALKNDLKFKLNLITTAVLIMATHPALADRLESVAANAKSEITLVAQSGVGIGIVAGGLLMAIGASQVGKFVLMSGLIGALAVFGGPALVEAIRSIVGQ
jgi:hypothetical protein